MMTEEKDSADKHSSLPPDAGDRSRRPGRQAQAAEKLRSTPPLPSRRRLVEGLRRLASADYLIIGIAPVLIGLLSGGAAIAFRDLILSVQWLGYGVADERLASAAETLPWWHLLLVPSVGGLVVGLAIYGVMPGRRPQSVPEVIEAAALKGGRMSLTTGIKAAIVSAISLGVGGSAGREGPVVHLGATIGSHLAKRLHLGRRQMRMLLGCGVAAGVAASFNAPIAGVFFALEVVVGHYALSTFAPIVIAGVMGTLVSRMHYGNFPAFILPAEHMEVSLWEFPAFALLGITAAIAALLFMHAIVLADWCFSRTRLPRWCQPAVGGLLIGVIAIEFPHVLGVGYEATDAALQERYGLLFLLALIVAKSAATAITLGSGFGGGIFSPSLFVGAMVGGAFGIIAGSVFPELASSHGAYTIVGMGAVSGAVLGAPISTILIVFEMTGNYALTIALMIATALASVIVQQLHGHSFFTWQLARRGVRVQGGRDVGLLRDAKVRDLLDAEVSSVAPETPLSAVRAAFVEARYGELMVVDADGVLKALITYGELASVAFDGEEHADMTAQSIGRENPPLLTADDGLETAIRVFRRTGEAHLPVVDSRDSRRLLGLAHEHEVMAAYHRALLQGQAEEFVR